MAKILYTHLYTFHFVRQKSCVFIILAIFLALIFYNYIRYYYIGGVNK
jgi:hypothetical protein